VKATRPAFLLAIAIAVGAISWAVVRFTYVSLPPLPWSMVPSLLVLAFVEGYVAFNIRARIRRKPGTRPIEPMNVARMAALAKASAYAAAGLVGLFGGFAFYLGSSLEKETPRHDFLVSAGTLGAAVILVAAALFLEYACRVPKDRDKNPRRGSYRR
jgi:cation transport ATPase